MNKIKHQNVVKMNKNTGKDQKSKIEKYSFELL